MALTAAELRAVYVVDEAPLDKSLKGIPGKVAKVKPEKVKIDGDDRGLQRTAKSAETRIGKMATSVKDDLTRMALGFVALNTVGQFIGASISAASQAEQSLGGAQAVFKDYAQSVITASEEADQALGLSANSYRELATVIGSQLKNAGVPMDELSVKTGDLISMGADLAAMFGGTTEKAVQALSSALKGEMDPIEAYGISLNDTALKAEAAALGLDVMGGTLTTQQRAMAVMSAVTKQGADAVGAFGREQDTAAGRAARASAQWENAKVALGEKLLPAMTGVVDFLSGTMIPAFGVVVSAVGGFIDVLGPVAGFLIDNKTLALALGTVLAVHLVGGITAVQAALARFVFGPLLLGLGGLLNASILIGPAMRAAAGAVAGFIASAAPLAAIGGVVFAFSEFASNAAAVEEQLKTAGKAGEDFAQVLADQGGELNDTTREAASLAVETAGVADAFDAAGISADTVTEALTGNKKAYEEALAAAQAMDAETSFIGNSWGLLGVSMDVVSGRATQNAEAFKVLADKANDNAEATRGQTAATEAAAPPLNDYATQLQAAADAADEASSKTDLLKTSLDLLTGRTVTAIEAEAAFQAAVAAAEGAVADLSGSVLDGAGNLNVQSEAGPAAADVLLGVRDSGNQLIATLIQQGATADEVAARDAQLRGSFIATARQMGIGEAAANALADQILGIPRERQVSINTNIDAAAAKIADIQARINNLQGKTVAIQIAAITGRSVAQSQYLYDKQRASGGPVWPGETFLVGERGPELVRFSGHGTVIPAGESARLMAMGNQQAAAGITAGIPAAAYAPPVAAAPAGGQQPAGRGALFHADKVTVIEGTPVDVARELELGARTRGNW